MQVIYHFAYRLTRTRTGSVMNLLVSSRTSCGRVADTRRTWEEGGRYLHVRYQFCYFEVGFAKLSLIGQNGEELEHCTNQNLQCF